MRSREAQLPNLLLFVFNFQVNDVNKESKAKILHMNTQLYKFKAKV